MKYKILLVLFFSLWIVESQANLSKLDSLQKVWNNTNNADSARLKAVHKLIWSKWLNRNPDTALILINEQYKLANSIGNEYYQGKALNSMGVAQKYKGELDSAVYFFEKAYQIRLKIDDKKGAANCINNIGVILGRQGQYPKAIEMYFKSLKLQEELGYNEGIGNAYVNIGRIKYMLLDFEKANFYFDKSIEYFEKENLQRRIIYAKHNKGLILFEQNQFSEALDVFNDVKQFQIENSVLNELGRTYTVLSTCYLHMEELDSAFSYQEKAIALRLQTKSHRDLALNYANMVRLLNTKKMFSEALVYGEKGMLIADSTDYFFAKTKINQYLVNSYKGLSNYEKALETHEIYKIFSDSISYQESKKKIESQELTYEFEKRELELIKENEKQVALANQEKEQQILVSIIISGALLLTLVLLILIYKKYLQSSIQKRKIEEQNTEIKESSERLLSEQEKNYDLKLQQKQKDLETSVAENKMKLELKESLIKKLKELEEGDKKGLKSLILDMTQQVQREKKLDLMEENNDIVNSDFFNRISSLGNFSKTELEICSYIRLNLSTKEISEIRGGTEDSIRVTRSRIRKKLGLTSSEDMYAYINQI